MSTLRRPHRFPRPRPARHRCADRAGGPAARATEPSREVGLDELVGMPVRADGRRVGVVSDVALNGRLDHVLGLDVRCARRRAFVPWAFVDVGAKHLDVTTPAALQPGSGLELILSAGPRLSRVIHRGRSRVGRSGEIQACDPA